MVYVTGDLHGEFERFQKSAISRLKKGDTLLVCGDFGFLWNGDKAESRILKKLSKKRFQICFVDGTHENFELLDAYPIVDFAEGKAQKIADNIYHLMRGEIYTIEGKTLFAFGGGENEEEAELREESATHWEREMASEEELLHGMETLKNHDNQVDYIITHYPSGKLGGRIFSRQRKEPKISGLQVYFNQIEDNVTFKHWYFGSFHKDKSFGSLHTCVFLDILPLE